MTDDQYDEFLQDSCMRLHDIWSEAGGGELPPGFLAKLNDWLDGLFSDVRQESSEEGGTES